MEEADLLHGMLDDFSSGSNDDGESTEDDDVLGGGLFGDDNDSDGY